MRAFPSLLTVALTLSACAIGSHDPQTVTDHTGKGSALAQIMAECQEQTLAPGFDMIRSRVNMSMTGANPAPFMLTNMEVPAAAERVQIARWSAIRDSCSQRVIALISEPRAGMSPGSWQKVVEITEHNSQRQHALMMALARGEMSYGQFVQEDALIGVRTAAAIRPFTQEPGVTDQVAMAAPAADQSAEALGVFFGNLSATLESHDDAYDAGALGGSALAQIMAECQDQALAPEFDMIRSRVNMSMTGANPAPFMLTNMEVPTAAERIQIARWSAIRDSCSERVVALVSEPHAGMAPGLWQKVVETTGHDAQRQHALMMALARGEMPYGQFVQEDTLIGIRTAAAIRPFTQKAGVIDQVAMAALAADQSAVASGAFFGNLPGATLEPPIQTSSAAPRRRRSAGKRIGALHHDSGLPPGATQPYRYGQSSLSSSPTPDDGVTSPSSSEAGSRRPSHEMTRYHGAVAAAVGVDQHNHSDRTSSSKRCCSPGTSSISLAAAAYGNQSRIVRRGTQVTWQ